MGRVVAVGSTRATPPQLPPRRVPRAAPSSSIDELLGGFRDFCVACDSLLCPLNIDYPYVVPTHAANAHYRGADEFAASLVFSNCCSAAAGTAAAAAAACQTQIAPSITPNHCDRIPCVDPPACVAECLCKPCLLHPAMSSLKKLAPLLDRVLVERIAAPAKSVGGVLLPESAVQKVRWRHAVSPTRRPARAQLHTALRRPDPARPLLPCLRPQINSATVVAVGPGRRTSTGGHRRCLC